MFERFSNPARQAFILAQQEARARNHDHIDTEHVLLGVLGAGENVAGKVLESLDISVETMRQQVAKSIRRGRKTPSGPIPFTPQVKKALQLSLREALALGHNHIGTEHILLGLIGEGQGVAAQALVKRGADLEKVRGQVVRITPPGPIGKLTDGVRWAIAHAEEEGRAHNRDDIDTEHILLGLLREGKGVAAKALAALGVTVEAARQQVEEIIVSQGQQPPSANTPATPH